MVTGEENTEDMMNEFLWNFIDIAGAFPEKHPDERIWGHVMAYMPLSKRQEIIDLWSRKD